MTVEEVCVCIDSGGVIEYKDVSQRDEALRFLMDLGYEIHPITKSWIEDDPGDTDFIHPGLSTQRDSRLTLWSTTANKTIVSFSTVAKLIIQDDAPIDERSSEEFSEAFMALIS